MFGLLKKANSVASLQPQSANKLVIVKIRTVQLEHTLQTGVLEILEGKLYKPVYSDGQLLAYNCLFVK